MRPSAVDATDTMVTLSAGTLLGKEGRKQTVVEQGEGGGAKSKAGPAMVTLSAGTLLRKGVEEWQGVSKGKRAPIAHAPASRQN